MDDVAMHIAENLHLDMAWADDPFFEQHMRIAETGRCLTLAGLQGVRKIFGPIDPAHPLTSAPCDSFDKDWITDDVRFASEAFGRLILTQIAGCGRDTGFLHPFLGCLLQAHDIGSASCRERVYQ